LRVDDDDVETNDPNNFTEPGSSIDLNFRVLKLYCKDFKYFKTFSSFLSNSLFTFWHF